MELSRLLAGIARVPPGTDRPVQALQIDSRRVTAGDVFVAMPGAAADGRRFIADAVARGAVAVLCEADGDVPAGDVPAIAVTDLRRQLGALADRLHGEPSRELVVIGVTGTNGKTTCTQLLAQALDDVESRESARHCGIIGTLGYGFHDALDASLHTTPDAITVHRLLDRFRRDGASHVAMEVSSHALDQGRVNAVRFAVAVFTNLTRDHLDYHGDMASYGETKASLFRWPGLRAAVINADDDFGRSLISTLPKGVRVVSYGLNGGDVRARELRATHEGLHLVAETPAGPVTMDSPLFGRFNASNLLAVLATLLALDMPPAEAARRLARARAADGRVERFGGRGGQPLVVVDYAHTPDALQQVLKDLREHTRGRLICVFGCGGDRDRGKRPLMGRLAELLADEVILTDDNPRRESPAAILDEIRAGMSGTPTVMHDRRAAIAAAIARAGGDDIVLVAGKGHEDYQEINDVRHPYSDRATVRELVAA
ncbi:MAG: UDP-N-acetylmuramoyl-L-alanyl-D-glutamate--2,6-diaminopimelate ligase [Pseudomonadota bacterium]